MHGSGGRASATRATDRCKMHLVTRDSMPLVRGAPGLVASVRTFGFELSCSLCFLRP